MLSSLFKLLGYQPIPEPIPEPEPEPAPLSIKEQATEDGLPFIDVVSFELTEDSHNYGAFELDWNDIFVTQLRINGFNGKTDEDVVENWFTVVCRNIALETYEQEEANTVTDNSNAIESAGQFVRRKSRGDGKSEVQ